MRGGRKGFSIVVGETESDSKYGGERVYKQYGTGGAKDGRELGNSV